MNSELSALWSQASSESILDVIKSHFHTAKSGCGINILLWAKQALLRSRCSIIILPFNVPAWRVGMWLSSQRRLVSEKAVIEILLNGMLHGSVSRKHNNCCFLLPIPHRKSTRGMYRSMALRWVMLSLEMYNSQTRRCLYNVT